MASSTQHYRAVAPSHLSLAQLEQALAAADPTVALAPSRILRRVIKQACELRRPGLRVPHRKSFVIKRSLLTAIVEPHELRLPDAVAAPDVVILLPQPTVEFLEEASSARVLSKYWRLLFHARVHEAFDELLASGRLTASGVSERIGRLGSVEFEEARAVLRQEDLLLPPKDDVSTYVEFAAVYLELRYFAGSFLPAYFADLRDLERVDELLREDVDARGLFQATRPAGASEQPYRGDLSTEESVERQLPLAPSAAPSPWRFRRLIRRADRAVAVGNLVRGAIARMRAARFAPADHARQCRVEAKSHLSRLVHRLEQALGFTVAEAEDWSRSLAALLDVAARGIWSSEARLLYDLQKVCVDHERGVYALDLIRWATSLGRQPLKRELPGQRDVLMRKHLGAAKGRLHAVRVPTWVRSRLEGLVEAAIERTEAQLRARFRPRIEQALDEVGLTPQNLPESVACKKLIDELLDRVAERGFLAMGDLRDALSRNNLKLPDLADGRQFLEGDQLLQADALLAKRLDGVYRHGEVYLRWSQRLSSLAFGLPLGRTLTRNAALPFGGAFLIVKFFEHLVNTVRDHVLGTPELEPAWWLTAAMIVALGSFLWGLFYHRGFHRGVVDSVRAVSRFLRRAVVEWPSQFFALPAVRAVIDSQAFGWATRFGVKPLVMSALLIAAMNSVLGRRPTSWGMASMFVGVNLLMNSRLGRNVDELITDLAIESWRRFRIRVVAALFRLVIEVFQRLLEGLERLLYTVDEWLRFRAGEGPWSTAVKSVAGLVWSVIHYFIRLCVTLLVEPQLNPIKHFPVVTVTHKIIFPVLYGTIDYTLGAVSSLSAVWIHFIATITTLLVPGLFGFLVWELKENWRLYAANRPPRLEPVRIGHHGETVLQLLKPGFRSGTIPKLYAKLRRASRKAFWNGRWRAVRKQRDALEHVELILRRLVDRELLVLLQDSRRWGGLPIHSGEIHLGSNRITIEFGSPGRASPNLSLDFEDRGGLLVAGLVDYQWLATVPEASRRALEDALTGLYQLAGVDLVRQQIESHAAPDVVGYEFREEGLIVRLAPGAGPSRFYPLNPERRATPELSGQGPIEIMPASACREMVFSANPLSWRRWVAIWQGDAAAVEVPQDAEATRTMLPALDA